MTESAKPQYSQVLGYPAQSSSKRTQETAGRFVSNMGIKRMPASKYFRFLTNRSRYFQKTLVFETCVA